VLPLGWAAVERPVWSRSRLVPVVAVDDLLVSKTGLRPDWRPGETQLG